MSWWGTLEAEFKGGGSVLSVDVVASDVPRGSESGPSVDEFEKGTIHVSGRLRDVSDADHSFAVLAWFVSHARWTDEATLTWELDAGYLYRYEYTREGGLTRVRGVLDL